MELTTSPNASFSFNRVYPPSVPPIDLKKALELSDLIFNSNLEQIDTVPFTEFSRANKMSYDLASRRPKHGDPEETFLIESFLCAERVFHEEGATDPRIPFLFAQLLIRLDDYDYALSCLQRLEANLFIPSTDVTAAISQTRQLRAGRVTQSLNALSQLDLSRVGWAYTTCAPLPDTLGPTSIPLIQFAPFTLGRLSADDLERILRSFSVQTNVIEGVLKLNAGQSETLIVLGFASSTFSHVFAPDMSVKYIQQTLLDSQSAIQLVLDRVGSANAKFDEAFVCELHRVFTKTACIVSQKAGDNVVSVHIGRGRYKFLSNHVLARNGAYHIYCLPEQVSTEMKKVLDMLEVYLAKTKTTAENGIYLAAWFHHRFVNIHPFRDGNGRVTRAIVSAILLRFGLLPFVVPVQDKDDYFRALMAADADASNLLPLAKFVAREQLQTFFVCKTRQLPDRQQPSTFRRLRIEEAHTFIHQKASAIAGTYNWMVNLAPRAPSLTVHLQDYRILELSERDVYVPRPIYLIYGSLSPLETDIFAFYIVTPYPQDNNIASVRGLTGVWYSEAIDVWTTRLEQFLETDLDEVLNLHRGDFSRYQAS